MYDLQVFFPFCEFIFHFLDGLVPFEAQTFQILMKFNLLLLSFVIWTFGVI
jgi:hypothetical protein